MKLFLMINIFLVLAICLNTEVKTIHSYSFELTTKKESVILLHADTDGDKVKDFDFLISREELKHILKKGDFPFQICNSTKLKQRIRSVFTSLNHLPKTKNMRKQISGWKGNFKLEHATKIED